MSEILFGIQFVVGVALGVVALALIFFLSVWTMASVVNLFAKCSRPCKTKGKLSNMSKNED